MLLLVCIMHYIVVIEWVLFLRKCYTFLRAELYFQTGVHKTKQFTELKYYLLMLYLSL